MIEKKILRNNLAKVFKYSLSSSLVGGAVTMMVGLTGLLSSPMPRLQTAFVYLAIGLVFGFFIPLMARIFLDVMLTQRRIKRLSFLGRHLLLLASVLASMAVIHLVLGAALFPGFFFTETAFLVTGSITLVVYLIVSAQAVVKEFIGDQCVRDIMLGRFHRARQDEKIFLFIDLRGSTALAESLTPVQFFELLNDFLSVVEQCCHFYGGRVYKYLGDGSITVWPARTDSYARAVSAVKDIEAELAEQNPVFEKKYGKPLSLTAGLHAGAVLVGELGNFRKEVGYWGDAVNTAQRIQAACKEQGVTNLCSEEFYRRLNKSDSNITAAATFEKVALRGKEQPMTLLSF